MSRLSLETGHRTSTRVPTLFDMTLRGQRRDRAARSGPELFLFERTFEDCLERIALLDRRFDAALLLGCQDAGWPTRLGKIAGLVDVRDPSPLFAGAAGGQPVIEDQWDPPAQAYDLVLAIGTLDTVNDLPHALRSIFAAMRPGGLVIGAVSGGDTLPQLRSAMRVADFVSGGASPHVHPRIEASALAPLLAQADFVMPVVDVDRVQAFYPSFGRLVADLRAMGATNILEARSRRALSKQALTAAAIAFAEAGDGTTTLETFEILHFAAWTPKG
jgi:NADH dehydrogenase [ubiquinone] 1 alpha subcomplex assembly factor 5